jgi:hypothetical protein
MNLRFVMIVYELINACVINMSLWFYEVDLNLILVHATNYLLNVLFLLTDIITCLVDKFFYVVFF